jgi:hypothetical protein
MGKLIGQVAVARHPESFQLDNADARMFVNVPDAGVVAIIDRSAMSTTTTFAVTAARACFPMALDEANHRVFIGCRQPAKVVVLDTANGHVVTAFDTVQDADDLFYDASRKRIYVSGGEGFLDVILEPTPNTFTRIARVTTAPGRENQPVRRGPGPVLPRGPGARRAARGDTHVRRALKKEGLTSSNDPAVWSPAKRLSTSCPEAAMRSNRSGLHGRPRHYQCGSTRSAACPC